jgi:hypothetical protein
MKADLFVGVKRANLLCQSVNYTVKSFMVSFAGSSATVNLGKKREPLAF